MNESYGLLDGIEVNYSYIHTLLGTMFFLLSSHPSKSLTPSGLEQMSCYSFPLTPALPTRTLALPLSLSHLGTFQSRRYPRMKRNRSFLITILCGFMCLRPSQDSLLRISSPELAADVSLMHFECNYWIKHTIDHINCFSTPFLFSAVIRVFV